MRKSLLVISILLSLMLFISCTKEQTCTVTEKDGVKTYRNKNIPSVEKLDFNPVKKFEINNDSTDVNFISYFDIDMIGVDSEKSIFIADFGSVPKVNKYDKDGRFVRTFFRHGAGPGETGQIIYLCVKNDSVYIADVSQTVSVFDNSGEFLYRFRPEGYRFQLKPVGKNKFVCSLLNGREVEGRQLITEELTLLNNSFQTIKVLDKIEYYIDDRNIPATWLYTSISNDKVFIGAGDDMYYKVNVFNHDGDMIEKIYKNYASILFTDEEYEKMTRYLRGTGQASIKRTQAYKKRAVVGVYNDKYGNLIIHPAVDTSKGNTDGMILDFFNKDNIYLNSYLFKTDKPYYQCDFDTFLSFYGDRMFKFDTVRSALEVYEY